jgi:hypothetical protein
MKNTTFTSIVFILFTCMQVWAKAPIKFGKVSMEEMTMERYGPDTSAAAVVLCQYGYFRANDFEFTQIIRIKILKKSGLDFGTKVFNTYSKSSIKGYTYNLENGEIVKEKLKNESIFAERIIDNYYRMKVTMPNVKVGSVIDIMFFEEFLPDEFRFQEVIPVKYAKLVLEESPYIRFKKQMKGFISLDQSKYGTYVAENVPAFKSEPYISSINNYIAKFEFEILDVNVPGLYIPFSTSWDAISNRLAQATHFGGALEGALYLNSIANEIEASAQTHEDKIKKAFEYVQKVRWNQYESLYASDQSMGYVYKQQYGNSADINIILIQLLRKLGYMVNPVVLSTRENGLLGFYPSRSKLNYVIACCVIDGEKLLLDATEEHLPYNLLPRRALNYQGRLLTKDNNHFMSIKPQGKEMEMVTSDFTITPDFKISGSYVCQMKDYAAYDFRKQYLSYNSQEEFLEYYVTDKPGLSINQAEILNIGDIYLPVEARFQVEIQNQLDVFGNEIYLQPLLFEQLTENPLKMDARLYPVDFVVPISNNYIMKYTIPEGYTVSKTPSPLKLTLPDNKGTILYNVVTFGNILQVTCIYNISNPLFTSEEYLYLKEFFNQVVKKQAEPVVLVKSAPQASN